MTHSRSLIRTLLGITSLIVCTFGAACGANHHNSHDGAIWFVHATDPHRFLYTTEDATDAVKKSTAFQESHDRDVLSGFFQRVGTLQQTSGPPAFILITGDFGVDPCLIPNADTLKKPEKTRTLDACVINFDKKKRDDEVEEFSALFSASPVRNIYLVAGNNDLPLETADDVGIAYFNQFFQDVQNKISAKNIDVRLHNLTGCYGSKGGAISDCSPDIPGTAYRIIGFPSYSFKNKEPGHEKNPALQAAQFTTFRGLLDEAIKDNKKIIIATHVPEIDDPYYLARDRYDGVKPEPSIDADKDNPRSAYSTWNVQKSLLDEWTKVLASDSVVAVLAGHLHDGHKEIYERPYSWSTLKDYQMGFRKLFLAPPLAVKNQDGSPIQARGFSVVSLDSDRVKERLYWYDGRTATFNPDSSNEHDFGTRRYRPSFARWIAGWFAWLWNLDENGTALERMATLLIALLTAFLTVVAVWQIPPPDDPLTNKPAGTVAKDANTDAKAASAETDSPFTNRLGKTVLTGLGGLVFAEVTKTLGTSNPGADTKWYYIVCFIFFFFFLLLFLNLLRAVAEALRSRVAVIYYPLARAGEQNWLWYQLVSVFRWIVSLRVPLLTFFDTFINLIQGKNQTNSQAFADAMIDQQRNVIRVCDTIRKRLHELLQAKIRCKTVKPGTAQEKATPGEAATSPDEADTKKPDKPPRGEVRVSISVLSTDQTNLFYISRNPGSSHSTFPKISVAWVSVFTGKNRWYETGYLHKNVRLFDNDSKHKTIADAPEDVMLDAYYADRHDDYQAFVVLPFPQPQRAFESDYVKGAIHISFRSDEDFKEIWPTAGVFVASTRNAVPPKDKAPQTPSDEKEPSTWWKEFAGWFSETFGIKGSGEPAQATGGAAGGSLKPYPEPDHLLDDWCPDLEIKAALNDAVAVLGELLHGFNEVIYKTCIQPNQGD
jgi:Calcineurin-like phosphoesterase